MIKHPRYLLFLIDKYYPSGGWDDLVATSDDSEYLLEQAAAANRDWYQLVDLKQHKILYQGEPRRLWALHQERETHGKDMD